MKIVRSARARACWQGVLVALCSLPGLALACTVDQNTYGQVLVGLLPEAPADQVIMPFQYGVSNGNGRLRGCAPSQNVRIRIDPALQGLTYVRDVTIAGVSYPAYGLHPTSPLLVFRHVWFTDRRLVNTPLQIGRSVTIDARTDDRGELHTGFEVAMLGRGGTMTGHRADIGVVESTVLSPSPATVTHRKRIDLFITPDSCEVGLPLGGVTLDPVAQARLQQPGQSAGEKTLNAQVFCSQIGATAVLRLDDAMDASNTGSVLAPAAGTTAGGVGLQILRRGMPVQFGQEWETVAGESWTELDLSARYLRLNEDISSGELQGQVILTATHR